MTQPEMHPLDANAPAPLPLVPPRRRRWVTLLVPLIAFACGTMLGIGGTVRFIDRRVQEAIHHPEMMPQRVAARLKSRLGLSERQHDEVLEILRDRQTQLTAIRRDVQPKVEAVLDGVEQDVSKVLDASQREKWLHDVHRLRERFTPPMPEGAKGESGKPKAEKDKPADEK